MTGDRVAKIIPLSPEIIRGSARAAFGAMDPRAALRAALVQQEQAAERCQSARSALARGDELVAEVAAEVSSHEAAEERAKMAAARANLDRREQGETTAFAMPPYEDAPAKAEAEERLRIARATREDLADAVALAQAATERAGAEIDMAFARIVQVETAMLAKTLAALEDEAAQIRYRLGTYGLYISLPGRSPTPVSMAPEAAVLVRSVPANARLDGGGPRLIRHHEFWRTLRGRLLADPDAPFDETMDTRRAVAVAPGEVAGSPPRAREEGKSL